MNEWRETRVAVMSGEKEGGLIRRARKLCRAECGWLNAPKGLWGVCVVGGHSRPIDNATREKMNLTQQEEMTVLVVRVRFLINPSPCRCCMTVLQADCVGFHDVIPRWNT